MTIFLAVVLIAAGFALGRRSARRGSSTPPADPYMAAARAYCQDRFPYNGAYISPNGAAEHLDYDARSTAEERWLRVVVDAALGREGDHV